MMRNFVVLLIVGLTLSACGSSSHRPVYSGHQASTKGVPGFTDDGRKTSPYIKLGQSYSVDGETYEPHYEPDYVEEGMASWYGPGFHGGKTANGEQFDKNGLTAAHRTLPLPSIVRVTLLSTGKQAYVRVNDRGPFAHSRIIDLSYGAAKEIGLVAKGTDRVRVEYMPQESQRFVDLLNQGREPDTIDLADEVIGKASTQVAQNDAYIASKSASPKPSLLSHLNPISTAYAQEMEPASSKANGTPQETQDSATVDSISTEDLPAPAGAPPKRSETAIKTNDEMKPQPSPFAAIGPASAPQPIMDEVPTTKKSTVASTVSTAPASSTAGNYIQLGAFLQETNAERLRVKAAKIGPTAIATKTGENDSTFYVVRMGPYETVDESTRVLAQLGSLGVNPKLVSK